MVFFVRRYSPTPLVTRVLKNRRNFRPKWVTIKTPLHAADISNFKLGYHGYVQQSPGKCKKPSLPLSLFPSFHKATRPNGGHSIHFNLTGETFLSTVSSEPLHRGLNIYTFPRAFFPSKGKVRLNAKCFANVYLPANLSRSAIDAATKGLFLYYVILAIFYPLPPPV